MAPALPFEHLESPDRRPGAYGKGLFWKVLEAYSPPPVITRKL